jgi:hypothetical protein
MLRKSTQLIRQQTRAFAKPPRQPKDQRKDAISNADNGFDYKKDKSMRAWGVNIFAFLCILAASAKVTEKIVDHYFYNDTETKLSDGPKFLQAGKGNVYKSKEEIDNELINAKRLTPDDLKFKRFFSHGRNYFLQVSGSDSKPHDHYHHLK